MVAARLTQDIADWLGGLSWSAVSEPVRRIARQHMLDGYGLAIAGAAEPAHTILRALPSTTGTPEATVLGTALRAPAEIAACLNGLAIHAQDFDDTQLATSGEGVYGLLTHPTAPVMAAAAAAAELYGASGAEMTLAYVAGVEVACRVADAINPRHYTEGFHSTGTAGAFGAAAAAAKLLQLSPAQTATAFGIAAPLGGGYRENFGTMSKPLHAGIAAQAGVTGARLALAGFTAADSILEAPRGFFNAAGGGFAEDRIAGRLGMPWYLSNPGVSIKPYPCGSLSHPAIALVLDEVSAGLQADEVAGVTVRTNTATRNALLHDHPQSGLEAKFSMAYVVAAALVRGRVGLAEFTDEAARDPLIEAVRARCLHVGDPELDTAGFDEMRTRVGVTLTGGRRKELEGSLAPGHPRRPMSDVEVMAKFSECAAWAGVHVEESLIVSLAACDSAPDVRELHSRLASAAESPRKG